MDHSDCDGEWTAEECKAIEALLRPKLADIPVSEDGGGHLGNMSETVTTFLDGLLYCAEHNVVACFA
jgi:hypothetical protein